MDTVTRREVLKIGLGSLAASSVGGNWAAGQTPRRRPNLLFVFADQMRAMSLGCAGVEQVRTPHLDQFAGEGLRLTNAISNCAVCAPYRGSMLTGRFPLSSTVFTNNIQLPVDMPSLGSILSGAGYRTGYIGKWHLAGEPATNGFVPPGPMRHGFQYWAVHNDAHVYWHGVYYRDTSKPLIFPAWEPDGQTDLALDFLKSQTGDQPFALVISWGPPHTPFLAPPETEALYAARELALRPNVHVMSDSLRWLDDYQYQRPNADPDLVMRQMTLAYYAAISNLDQNFGRLMRCLEETGNARDTIVVFTSDHGEMLGSHGQFHKLQPWDESVRVPFLLRYPGEIKAGSRSDVLLSTPDILPSLLGLMEVKAPSGIEGTDFSRLLSGDASSQPSSALLLCPCAATTWGGHWGSLALGGRGFPPGFMRPYRGVRTATHTFVRDRSGPWMLYDNEKDPYQQNELLSTRGKGAIPSECERELSQWLERTGDFFGDGKEYSKHVDLTTGIVVTPEALRRPPG
jgi:arylsulfatase A-like enzyme